MQKHERLAIKEINRVLAGLGLAISHEGGGRGKMHVIVEGEGIRERKTLSSSPGSERSEIDHARQWATRIRRTIVAPAS